MNIRPKHIPIYQGGSTFDLDKWIKENQNYYNWFSNLYKNAQILQGDPLKQRTDNWNKEQLSSSHHTTDDLRRSAYNNYLYTKDYDARQRDLTYWSEQQKGLKDLSDQQIVDLYNTQAQSIRDAREAPQTYNKPGYADTNRTFKTMFFNRSKTGTNLPDYNIGYQNNIDDIEGTSTWQRRMDRYENPFEKDTQEGQQNRTFYITFPNGRQIKVYKKENGDLGLFPNSPNNPPSEDQKKEEKQFGINPNETKDKESLWNKLSAGFKNIAPDLLDAVRLAGNLHNNERVYNESLKAVKPNLQQSYNTHRQVFGDEATKQAFYKKATQGESRAAQSFTSDADRQMAYMMEAKRVGDELRSQGDLADNQRIRETSTESAAHQDANKERDTQVANNNLTEILKAEAAKHQLTAQRYSANWTNWDQFLLGKQSQFNQEKAEQKLLDKQKQTLANQQLILNDNNLTSLKSAAEKAYDEYYKDSTNTQKKEDYEKKRKEYLNYYYSLQQQILDRTRLAKSGAKIERKYKDETQKYLYKTSKDIVEHFRKMSKMTDDSRIRTLPKTIKLTSHPKKYQLGGVAPFTVYRPLGVGGESAVSTQTSSSTSSDKKSDAAKDKLDMIKELFKAIQGQGLPVDVSQVYSEIQHLLGKAKAFGDELSTDDIASMYLSSMNKISNLKYSKDVFDKAKAQATANEALNEFAVTTGGKLILQDQNSGKLKFGSYEELISSEGKLNALTNDQLLNLRAYSPNMALAKGDELMQVVNNGIGMNKIAKQIKELATTIGSTEQKIEGISQVESNRIKAGLQILAGTDETPDGYYKISKDQKNSSAQVKAALTYIKHMLPENYKTILDIHSKGNSEALIASFLSSQVSDSYKEDIAPLTGKASSKDNDKESSDGLKLDAATALVTGKGYKAEIELNPGSSYAVKATGRFSEFQKNSGENMGAGTTMQEATESTLKGNLDWNKATIGGSKIIPTAYNQVILNNGEVAGVDLPIDPNNPDTPDFDVLKQLENLDKQLKLNNIEDNKQNWQKVNDLCDKLGIPKKYDSSGKLNKTQWKRFAAFQVTTPDTALVNKNVILDMVGVADKQERDLYNTFIQQKTNNKNFELSDTFLGVFGHRDELYKGTVFVPIKENIVASAISSGQNIHMSQATDLELREQGYDPKKINSYKKSDLRV